MDSRDILFYTLALSAAVVAGFFAWFTYYLIRIIRTVSQTAEDFRDRLATIDEILQTIKEKITSTHIELTALAAGLKQLMTFFANRRAKRRTSTRASKSSDED